MRPELEHLRLLERHLHGRATAAETTAWQLQLHLDPALEAEIAAQQQLYEGLREAGRRQLRQELATIHARLHPPHRRSWLGAAVAAVRRLGRHR